MIEICVVTSIDLTIKNDIQLNKIKNSQWHPLHLYRSTLYFLYRSSGKKIAVSIYKNAALMHLTALNAPCILGCPAIQNWLVGVRYARQRRNINRVCIERS